MQSDAQALIAALRSALERKCSTSATAVSAATAVSTALLALCGAEEGFSDDELTNLRGGLDVCAKNAMDQRAKRVRTMAAAHSASLCVSLRGVALPLSVCTTVIAQFVAPAERCRTLALVSRDWREVAGAPEAWPALYGFRRKYNIGLLKAALAAARFQRLVALELPSMCQGQTLWRVVMDACPHLAVIDAGSLSGTASRAHSERLAAAVCSPLSIVALRLPYVPPQPPLLPLLLPALAPTHCSLPAVTAARSTSAMASARWRPRSPPSRASARCRSSGGPMKAAGPR